MIRIAIAAALLATAASPAAAAEPPTPAQNSSAAEPATPAHKPAATKPTKTRAASAGKPRAPVRVEGQLVQGNVHFELTFDSPARNVVVRLHGTNGLTVATPDPQLPKTDFAGGEKLPLDVAFTAPPGQAHVVVSVDGDFNGVRQGTVASFRVGKLSAAQQKQQDRGVVDDGKGGKLRVGTAQER